MARTADVGRTLQPKPFLKWAGGKGQLLPQLRALLPTSFRAYHEAFLGGGALFFGLSPRVARLTDLNAELVSCYISVRDDVESVINALKEYRNSSDHYYAARALDPASLSPPERASRMIFLNKTAFNGLYRVNTKGVFNVPFGRHRNPLICDADNLRSCSETLACAEIAISDFTSVAEHAKPDDFVYFDPPYVPVSETSHFTEYSAAGFGWKDQERLAALVRSLTIRNVKAAVSNADTPEIRRLYEGFRIETVLATRRINSQVAGRGKIGEVVVVNYSFADPRTPARLGQAAT